MPLHECSMLYCDHTVTCSIGTALKCHMKSKTPSKHNPNQTQSQAESPHYSPIDSHHTPYSTAQHHRHKQHNLIVAPKPSTSKRQRHHTTFGISTKDKTSASNQSQLPCRTLSSLDLSSPRRRHRAASDFLALSLLVRTN